MNKKGLAPSTTVSILVVLVVILVLMAGFWMWSTQKQAVTPTAPGQGGQGLVGKASTVYIQAHDVEDYSKGLVTPELYITDSAGNFLVDGVTASSVNTVVNEKLSFYGADLTTYYTDAKLDYSVPNEAPTVNLDSHAIAAEGSMAVTGYDRTGSTALTANTNGTDTNDYGMTLGANQNEIFYVELENKDTESMFKLKTVCVMYANDIADVTVEDADWTTDAMPKEIRNQAVTMTNNLGTTATVNYKTCYVYKKGTSETVDLQEWDRFKLKLKVSAGSSDPTADTFDEFGVLFLDAGNVKGSDSKVHFDYFVHNIDEKVSDVGMAETISSPQGLQIGAMVEGL